MNRLILIAALTTLIVTGCGKPPPSPPAPTTAKAPAAATPPAPATTSSVKGVTEAAGPVAATAIAPLDDAKALEIMNKSGCAVCHAIDKKIVGPAYTDVAKKRKGEEGAAAMLVKKVREGGAGAYGSIPMPPNPASRISDNDLKAMVDWILTK